MKLKREPFRSSGFPGSSAGKESAGFPGSSAGKESACNAGDPGLIPGLGRCPGEGILTHSSILGLLWWFRQ